LKIEKIIYIGKVMLKKISVDWRKYIHGEDMLEKYQMWITQKYTGGDMPKYKS